jgi:uncharacterized protein involved in exopolysaccharide biosynthesis
MQAENIKLRHALSAVTADKQVADKELSALSEQLNLAMDGLSRAETTLAEAETRKSKLKVRAHVFHVIASTLLRVFGACFCVVARNIFENRKPRWKRPHSK